MTRVARARWIFAPMLIAMSSSLITPSAVARDPDGDAPPFQLPEELQAMLAEVVDEQRRFDVPAFYALLRHVREQVPPTVVGNDRDDSSAESATASREIDDWRAFTERPSDFRGRWVTIEGRIGRNKRYTLDGHPDVGTLGQLELTDAALPLPLTVVTPSDTLSLPVQSRVRVSGYFLLVRSYLDTKQTARHAPLIVAPRWAISVLETPSVPVERDYSMLVYAASGGLLAGFLLLRLARRGARARPRGIDALRSEGYATATLGAAHDDADAPTGSRDVDPKHVAPADDAPGPHNPVRDHD